MNIHHYKTSIWQDAAFCEQPIGGQGRSRAPGTAKYIFCAIIASMSCRKSSIFCAGT
jgi:hypothetical protein